MLRYCFFAAFVGVGILSVWADSVLDSRSTVFVTGLPVLSTAGLVWVIRLLSRGNGGCSAAP